jgi:hypothetical protein
MTPIITLLLLVGIAMHLISAQTILECRNVPPAIFYGDGSSSCPSEQQRATSLQEIQERIAAGILQPFHQCGAGEWIRVVYLDMKDPLQTCPPAWTDLNDTISGVRVCGRPPNSNDMCHGTFYSTGGRTFNKVCGRIIGYQIGHPDAFLSFDSINSVYVDGVSITYMAVHEHIYGRML